MEQFNAKLVSLDLHPARAVLRSFGLALALLCMVVAHGGDWHWTHVLYTGSAVAVASLWRPSLFRAPYVALNVLTFPIRWLIAFATLAALYFLVLTPIACILRVTRRTTQSSDTPTAWQISPTRGDKPSYFRQF